MAFGANENAYDMGWQAYFMGQRNPFRSGSVNAVRFALGYKAARMADAEQKKGN